MTELSEFLYHLSLTEKFISDNMKSKMGIRDFLIGWDDANAFGGDEFLYKNGYLPEGQAKSAIYSFKNGLQISVIFNEEDSAMKNKDYIYIAYAKAWAHSMTR